MFLRNYDLILKYLLKMDFYINNILYLIKLNQKKNHIDI